MYFLDKRSKNKELLITESFLLAKKETERYIRIFQKSTPFPFLFNNFSKKLILAYFKKKFFYENIHIFNQIVINRYDKKPGRKLIYNNYEQKKILEALNKNLIYNNQAYSIKNQKIFKALITEFKPLYYKLLKLTNSKKKKLNYNTPKIAVSLVEGLDPNLKSDVFWDPLIKNKKDTIIYIESPYLLRKLKYHLPYIEKLEKNGTLIINIWEEDIQKDNFKETILKIKNIKTKSILEKHFNNVSIELVSKVNFWVNFFNKYNIKIHIDSDNLKIDNIAKQIALDLIGGCSVGKTKSYISPHSPLFFEYYHNDIFFCWGKRLVNNLKSMKKIGMISYVKNLVISGDLNQINNQKYLDINLEIKKNLKNKEIKKNILILDTSHSNNKNYNEQLLSSDKVNYFYNKIFNFALNNKKIGLIIKPKKNLKYLDKDTKKKLNKLIKTNNVYIEKNFKAPIKNFAKISDFVISLTVNSLPSAMLEALSGNNKLKGVFFDYAKCSKKEKIYSWGNKKVSFDDLDEMLVSIEKNIFTTDSKIGVWPKNFLKSLSPFKLNLNNYTANFYIQNLITQFKKFKNKDESISYANKLFKRKYGNNLIYKI